MEAEGRARLEDVLVDRVGARHQPGIEAMAEVAERVELVAGEVLLTEGTQSDAMFVITSGRLRVTRGGHAGSHADQSVIVLREIGRGTVVGELGIIDDHPRSATVTAIRPTVAYRVSRDAFDAVSEHQPHFVLALFRSLLSAAVRGTRTNDPASVIAIGGLGGAGADAVEGILTELRRHGAVMRATPEQLSAGLADRPEDYVVVDLGPNLEADSGFIASAIDNSDRVLVLVGADPSPADLTMLANAGRISNEIDGRTLWCAIEHPSGAAQARGATRLLAVDGVDEVHHYRQDRSTDLARIARLISGNGVGLALGGGGARAYGHLGVLQAFDELDIPIDRIGGTSQGGVISAWAAMGVNHKEMLTRASDLHQESVLDYTVPLVALTKGRRIVAKMAEFAEVEAENLWLPWFCITTNLTQGRAEVMRQGNLRQVLRATVSLPAIFPPVPIDGDLHVDGGLLDNVPADVLAADPSVSRVVAVDVTPPGGPRAKSDYGLSVGGRQAALAKVGRGGPLPDLMTTLTSSVLIGSDLARQSMLSKGLADVYLSLNLKGIGLFDFEGLEEIADRGWKAAHEPLRDWWATQPVG